MRGGRSARVLERQWLWSNRILWSVVPLVFGALAIAMWVEEGRPGRWLLVVLGAVALVCLIHMRTRVDAEGVEVWMWPIWRRRIPLSTIEAVWPVTFRPLRDFGGWGIRIGDGAVAFTVTGNTGVRLRVAGKKREVLLGSRSPDRIVAELQARGVRVEAARGVGTK